MREADAILLKLVQTLASTRRRALGLACAGPPPFGFRAATRRGVRSLVPDPHAKACAEAFLRWRRMGYSWFEI
jgi:hypothetical protein